MPHIEVNPTQATCPSFEDPKWEFLRQNMVDAHQGVPALTMDEASQRMKEAWARTHQRKLDTWNAQVQQDQVEQERIDGEMRDTQEAQRVQQEREAKETRKEVDKKKPKLNSIDQNLYVGKFIAVRPATYALNKLSNLEYVKLDYFTPKGCQEATADSNNIGKSGHFNLHPGGRLLHDPAHGSLEALEAHQKRRRSKLGRNDGRQKRHVTFHGKIPDVGR